MKLPALALLAVDFLACYRLTRLVVEDTFPPVKVVRDAIVRRHTTVRAITAGGTIEEPHALAELVQCPWCASFWLAALVVVARWNVPGWWTPVAVVLALSAVSGIVSGLVDGED